MPSGPTGGAGRLRQAPKKAGGRGRKTGTLWWKSRANGVLGEGRGKGFQAGRALLEKKHG
jgi:hypothetical protein